jgi:hypothetical protein
MSNISKSMFESIRSALASDEKSSTGTANILKTEVGNTYTVRLLPYMPDPSKTFFHYYQHGWNSFATGQYTAAVSPQTFGERDPIAEIRYKMYKGNDEQKQMASKIIRSEKWLVNAYIVNDPVTPENNGKVMVLRYGKQLHKVIASAIDGEDAQELGPRIFDLSPAGVNLRIVVEKQGDYPTYVSSKFTFPSEIKNLPESKYESVIESAMDLSTILTIKSYDELKQIVDRDILCIESSASEVEKPYNANTSNASSSPVTNSPVPHAVQNTSTASSAVDSDIQDLLDGLDL